MHDKCRLDTVKAVCRILELPTYEERLEAGHRLGNQALRAGEVKLLLDVTKWPEWTEMPS